MENDNNNNITGVVEAVTSSPGRGRAEGQVAWALTIAGESYSVGFRKPADVNIGDLVRFRLEVKDGRWKSAFDLRVLESSGPAPRPGPPAAVSSPAPISSRPAPVVAPSTGADPLRLVAAAVIVAAWASTSRPLDWSLEDFVSKVATVAKGLEKR